MSIRCSTCDTGVIPGVASPIFSRAIVDSAPKLATTASSAGRSDGDNATPGSACSSLVTNQSSALPRARIRFAGGYIDSQ